MSMFHAPHANICHVAHCSPLMSGMAAGMQPTTTAPMGYQVSCTSFYQMIPVCPSRPPHRPHHFAPADACAHVRCQVGDALLSSCPCCWRSFSPTKKAVLLVEHSFSVTFYTAVHGHAKDRQEGPAGAQQLPLTLTLTWPQAHSGQVGQVCDPLQLWVAC